LPLLWFLCMSLCTAGKPNLSDDPLFKIPSSASSSSSYFLSSLKNFRTQKLGALLERAYRDPASILRQAATIDASGHELLVAMGATGKKGVARLKLLLGLLERAEWIESAFNGLALSMTAEGHRAIVKNIGRYELRTDKISPILNAVGMRDPLTLVPLLSKPRLAQSAAEVMLAIPSLAVEMPLYAAVLRGRISLATYVSFLYRTMPHYPAARQENICRRLFALYPRVASAGISKREYWSVLSRCPSSLVDPRWLVLLGDEDYKLLMFKAMRNRRGMFFPGSLSKPLRDLMTEYIGSPGWERLMLSILGRIEEDKAVLMVASYVLSPNLWLREEALASLAFGAHLTSGKMLHAAALESAGEEAVLYFAPYFRNIAGRSWRAKSMKPLLGVLRRYIRAKDPAYSHAALFSLAWTPGSGSRTLWWPKAVEYHKGLVKEKKWGPMAGILPVMANHPLALPMLRLALSHEAADVRAAAALALGRLKDGQSKARLSALARSLTARVAVNATWALGRLEGTGGILRSLLSSSSQEVAGNAAIALMRRQPAGSMALCSTLFGQFTKNRLPAAVLVNAVSWMRRHCTAIHGTALLRFVASVPQFLVLTYFQGGDTNGLLRYQTRHKGFFLRLLNRFHVGQEGKPFRLNLTSGEVLYGSTTFGGVAYFPQEACADAPITWLN